MSADLIFEDPPPPGNGANNKVWRRRLEPLMAHPGQWVRLAGDFHEATGHHLRKGQYLVPPGRWEFEQRKIPESDMRRVRVWARYLGEEEA